MSMHKFNLTGDTNMRYTKEQIGEKVLREQTTRTKTANLYNLYVETDGIHEPVLTCVDWQTCADKTQELIKKGVSWTDIYGDMSKPLKDGGGCEPQSWGQCTKHLWHELKIKDQKINMLIFTIHDDYDNKLSEVYKAVEKLVKNQDQFFLDEECALRTDYAIYVRGTDEALTNFHNKLDQKYYDAVFEINENMSDDEKGDIFDYLNFEDTLQFNNYNYGLLPL
jgi:hypothetical protein